MPLGSLAQARTQTSPIFNYPYSRTREALHALTYFREPDSCHGFKMKYVNPMTGGWAMTTISTCMQLLPSGFATQSYRSTDSTVFVVVEGRGRSRVADQEFRWGPQDIFVVPSWTRHVHFAEQESTLFSYSDRVVQEKLELWREDRSLA